MLNIMNLMSVPLEFAKVQSTAAENVLQITGEIRQSTHNGTPILTSIQNLAGKGTKTPTSSTRTLNDRMTIKRNRMLRNRLAAKTSREKWKLHKSLLEQQLESLKKEKLRLLLENEELRLQQNQLEEENLSLKMRFQEDGEEMSESAFEHASFVNVPLQKEWVLPHIFTLLFLTLGKISNSSQLQQFLTCPSSKILTEYSNSVMHLTSMKKTDVFVCPLSQDVTKETAFHTDAAVARIISQEVEVSCTDEEMSPSPDLSSNHSEELVFDDIQFPQSALTPPQLWTFDNLYEDLDDCFSF